jgi:hypothetical protein
MRRGQAPIGIVAGRCLIGPLPKPHHGGRKKVGACGETVGACGETNRGLW